VIFTRRYSQGQVSAQLRTIKNKTKSWEGGTTAIDRNHFEGRNLGKFISTEGVNIGLPQKPESHEIINHGKKPKDQKWEIEEIPAGSNELTQNEKRFEEFYRAIQNRRSLIYLNGKRSTSQEHIGSLSNATTKKKIPPN
jgi:hypothetical protein